MKLWFQNAQGQERIIADCASYAEVNAAIDKFIADSNERMAAIQPNRHPFVHYYTRSWKQEDGRTVLDVGSWSEFFLWEGDYGPEV